MSDSAAWSEAESAVYRDLSRYAVPQRARQVAMVTALVRAAVAAGADGALLDLCCGEGLLSEALLAALPEARVLAYDGSDSMLATTRRRAGDTPRLETRLIDLATAGWRRFERPLGAVVSSLAIHHLDAAGKRALFADLHAALAPGGVFVLADVVQPATAAGQAIAAELWDEEVRRQALELDGDLSGFEAFERAEWNHFRHGGLDPIDKPSSLVEQLDWLRAAGFADVELHWMTAGQMIASGWRR
ncbi:tRNA (cmo5U34)-methyltransferase [Tistlia consotensis]|uniref:tRNA (Cmo5U34)-methyltransferase n=1 Tax=Tistlia consotensis USBA 355 TaxID=560819 RepID=A0A1Y6BC17_9PROT|nr:class I SAM-dependent methyltransferase [Tistlia consotensis]SMF00197.1 tRNA (cmo5U34)-methyltransferase [Tistlia consotensis USBA 355]SNR76152.1 tRNA (cmo5U34)-methyltransferase [Tistlia consotensis]